MIPSNNIDVNGTAGLSPNGSGGNGSPLSTTPRTNIAPAAPGIPRRPRRSSASQLVKQKAALPLRAPSLSPDSEPSRSGSSSGAGVGSPLKPAPGPYTVRDPEVVYPSAPLAMDTSYQNMPAESPVSASSTSSSVYMEQQQYMDQQQYPAPPGPPPMQQQSIPQTSIPMPHSQSSIPMPQSHSHSHSHSPQTPITPTTASHLPLDDGDKPFIFYPEYEQAQTVPLPLPKQAAYPADGGMGVGVGKYPAEMGASVGTDCSHLLNPAVAPGVLQAHYGQPGLVSYDQGYAYPAYGYVEGYAPVQVQEVEGWGGY
ncbi:hypothetical protein EVG20_g8410 [Dentipellis fragilis]|uniref:Uncharacterized protein n=1 Tax=Dentipellis fragilis TaxID=205917 RepID=A0A4Y9Y8M9_9AGAM|nr:hypothetical protein EVG20_g8410 [Dentipellis fragilis]